MRKMWGAVSVGSTALKGLDPLNTRSKKEIKPKME